MRQFKPKVILLTSDQPAAQALARAARALARAMVEAGIVVSGIIVERSPAQPKSWKEVIQSVLGEELYLRLISRRWAKETRKLVFTERALRRNAERQLTEFLGADAKVFPKAEVLVTDNVNSDSAHQFLKRKAPDLVVAFATGLLRKETMEAGRLGSINAHTSLLPAYR